PDAHALGEGLRDILGCLAPHVARQKHSFAVFPLISLGIEATRGRRYAKVRDWGTRRGRTQLWVSNNVANDRDIGIALCNGICLLRENRMNEFDPSIRYLLSVRRTLVCRTESFRLRRRSNSSTVADSHSRFTTA